MESNLNKDGDLEPLNAPKKATQEKQKNEAARSQLLLELRFSEDERDGSKSARKEKRDESRSHHEDELQKSDKHSRSIQDYEESLERKDQDLEEFARLMKKCK